MPWPARMPAPAIPSITCASRCPRRISTRSAGDSRRTALHCPASWSTRLAPAGRRRKPSTSATPMATCSRRATTTDETGEIMELRELNHDEQLALVALVEVVVSSDAAVTEEEESFVVRLASTLGEDAYHALIDEADERFPDEAELKEFLGTIQRQEARELIYGTVLEAALPDVVDPHESSLLGWLATAWRVT